MPRRTVSSNTEWESAVGYSRATRVGNVVHVAGTTATDDDGTPIDGGPYEQTTHILEQIERTLKAAGASVEDVTRTRLFVTDIDDWDESAGHTKRCSERSVRPPRWSKSNSSSIRRSVWRSKPTQSLRDLPRLSSTRSRFRQSGLVLVAIRPGGQRPPELGDTPPSADDSFPQPVGTKQPEQQRLAQLAFVLELQHAVGESRRRVRSVAQ